MDSFWFDFCKDYYSKNLFNDTDLENFVQVEMITEEQKSQIIVSKVATS